MDILEAEKIASEPDAKLNEDPEVVILDDDNECDVIDLVAKEMQGDSKCINYACKSGKDMLTAPLFCLSFYRVKKKNLASCVICTECYNDAMAFYEMMADSLISGEPLVDVDVPFRNDMVEIDDSDEEEQTVDMDDEQLTEQDMELVNTQLLDVLEESLEKYDINKQSEQILVTLKDKCGKCKDSITDIASTLSGLREQLDTMYIGVYDHFKTSYQCLPPIDITDSTAPIKRPSPLVGRTSGRILASTLSKPLSVQKKISSLPAEDPAKADVIFIEEPKDLPPKGLLVKTPLKLDNIYYSERHKMMGSWIRVKLMDIMMPGASINGTLCVTTSFGIIPESMKLRLNYSQRYVSGKEIAYSSPSPVQLVIGTRVIAVFRENGESDNKKIRRDIFYPGIVAESLSACNNYRYLIFFDDGYASYVAHNLVYVIYDSNKDVWEDVNIGSRSFIKKYLQQYPDRPMVKLQKEQKVRTEYNGKWWTTTVLDIDCSLVKMLFENSNRVEWIYRGSTRLSPLFKEEQAATSRLQNKQRTPRAITNNISSAPYVQYTREDGAAPEAVQQPQRAVARKSTAKTSQSLQQNIHVKPAVTVEHKDNSKSKIVYYTPRKQKPNTQVYKPHRCSPKCKEFMTCPLKRLVSYNPLAKPLLCGFNRLMYKWKNKKHIIYKAPCGRTLRNMEELHRYLRMTDSQLTVDFFNFELQIRCLAEFIIDDNQPLSKDLSTGQEEVPIQVVNYVDNEINEFCNYSTKRSPMEGVNLNLDPDFLCGCDCKDDCSDKSKCACWQQTLQGMKYMPKDTDPETVGYNYRRLLEPVHTGIYECNVRCKCASTCLNRVVQNPLQHKLQVFKTPSRGWGIRCINDIPEGAFLCIYAGVLLTDHMANEGGQCYGDEYLAELDYIEVVERMKEDYEAEAHEGENEKEPHDSAASESEASVHSEEDDSDTERSRRKGTDYEVDRDFVPNVKTPKNAKYTQDGSIRLRLRKRNNDDKNSSDDDKKMKESSGNNTYDDPDTVTISDDEDDVQRELLSFNPKTEPNLDDSKNGSSVRLLFGEDENVYIMDAKNTGNIGRFLNHSCSPNVFVQNVFVDTHDLRFPWVSFFANSYIRAGTELTWNYNYDVGSVPGKIMYCHCESSECKGRLL